MKKWSKKSLWTFLIVVIIVAVFYAAPRLPILTGYASKNLASGIFVSGRTQDQVENQELNFFPVNLAKNRVDYDNQIVTSSLLGLAKRKAVYREGLGCVSVIGYTTDELKRVKSPDINRFPGNQDTIPWPMGDVLSETLPAGVDYSRLNEIVDTAFDKAGEERVKTFALLVVYRDTVIAEKYAPGADKNTPLLGWSMTKSVSNALAGILYRKGLFDPAQPLGIPEWSDDERENILLGHMIHMNTGLEWVENYFNLSHVTRMLYMEKDMYQFAIQSELKDPPGDVWFYSSGTPNIWSGKMRTILGDGEDYLAFPSQELFHRIGMTSVVLETDPAGNFVFSSYMYATARDWARFGLLYLNDGIFNGDTILSPSWVDYTRQTASGSEGEYGAYFWLNRGDFLPDVPEDLFYCQGFKGQYVFIIPSCDLVVVRLGYSVSAFDKNDYLAAIISCIPEGSGEQ